MEKRVNIYALILLALCLVVPVVNALTVEFVPGGIVYADNEQYINVHVSIPDAETIFLYKLSPSITPIGSENGNDVTFYNILVGNGLHLMVVGEFYDCDHPDNDQCIVSYSYQMIVNAGKDPTTPEPTSPYITASVYNTGDNNLYYDYNVRCMPEEGYIFAPLSFTPYSFIIGFGQTPSYTQTSEETLIQVRVFAGGDVSMYSSALNVIDNSDYQHLSIVLSAPVYSAGTVVNNQTVHEELQNIPNPVTPSGGIVSGAWQPLALKQNLTIVNTPFSYIVDNYLHYFHFPEMAPPDVVKAELLNGTGNLTAPLYDTVDGLTGVMMIIPNYVSGVLTGLISPISETIMLVKDVILSLSDYVYNAMSVLYVFIPFIYLFIPDVIWWGITLYLSYLVFAWTMTLIFGYDVISVFYVDPFVSWVRKRRGGE